MHRVDAAMDTQEPPDRPLLPPLLRKGGALSPTAVAALCEQPQFAAAMRALLADNFSSIAATGSSIMSAMTAAA